MRIAIVNDVKLAVEALRRTITPMHEVAWIAEDGEECVEKCKKDKPDLILMDLIMPVMDGVEATRIIMETTPCPILVVTATVSGRMSRVFDAMNAGALDAVNTPIVSSQNNSESSRDLLDKIQAIGTLTRNKLKEKTRPPVKSVDHCISHIKDNALIAIGASTGGPSALLSILSKLPADFSVPIIIVQHLDEQFSENLAQWLDDHCPINVRIANKFDKPLPGTALLAGTNSHLIMKLDKSLAYTETDENNAYTPSVDVLFNSIVKHWDGNSVGVLLTGMGKDGAQGLLSMKNRGWTTIAQNAESCVVYGMPKAAAEIDAPTDVLALDAIPDAILDIFSDYKGVEWDKDIDRAI